MQYTKQIDRIIETDVLVIGGGSAGFGAAVAADLYHPVKDCLPLFLCPCFVRKALCSISGHCLPFYLLIIQLGKHTSDTSAVFQPVPLADHEVHAPSERCTGFPEGIIFDP